MLYKPKLVTIKVLLSVLWKMTRIVDAVES